MQKRCFVVMGFGIKTDFATGRKLDLDKSYKLLIKPVVEQKDLICIRADEIRHSGSIDVPMYQELLNADVVIADLSTANLNAVYELGVRHALRPKTTIVISEKQLPYPFDLNHIKITSYTHLGDAIDYDEVMRFRDDLGQTISAVLDGEQPDSPVYTFLKLIPPAMQDEAVKAVEKITGALEQAKPEPTVESKSNSTLSSLVDKGEKAIREKNFDEAILHFTNAINVGSNFNETANNRKNVAVSNPYLVQRLAFATYKATKPDKVTALKNAKLLLEKLDLDHTNDSETVILAGAIEKKLFEMLGEEQHLEDAILFYQRAFYLIHNRYNGINLAYLLNCRANSSLDSTEQEKIADMVWANRIRLEVLQMCNSEWEALKKRQSKVSGSRGEDEDLSRSQQSQENEQKFWILVNKAEASFGLGRFNEYEKATLQAEVVDHEPWMIESFTSQLNELRPMMKKLGHLLNPVWQEL